MHNALSDIISERVRQISEEGFDHERDDKYTDESLAQAAASYAHPDDYTAEAIWPSSWLKQKWFKRTTRRRDLVKAGALIIAEIERLDRIK